MMKIILDNIVFSLQKSGGISVVWYELLSRLFRDHFFISCIHYDNQNIFSTKLSYIEDKMINKGILRNPFVRYLNLRLPNEKEQFIFHSSYYRTSSNPLAINITTVHDFTYEYYNHGLSKWVHSLQKRRAIKRADYVICISEATKKDLLHFIPEFDEKKIKVIYNGVSDDYYKISALSLKKYELPSPIRSYALFVGARDGYKNFSLAVKAIASSQLNLVIVGAPLSNEEKSFLKEHFEDMTRVFCTGRIDNVQLNVFYNCAYVLLYPSKYEGFGIPVLEAQKAGCPVIAYNASSIPEIIGDDSLLIHELSVDEIHRCLKILEDDTMRLQIINKGIINAQRFSWERMYDQVVELYHKAWNEKV